jgi:K+-sensing histidine kinase KdpD
MRRVVTKIVDMRKPRTSSDEKSVWRHVLESPVMVALITVLVGGLLTQYIISRVQQTTKENEQAEQDHKQLLQRQEDIIQRAYGLAGACISDAHRLISLTEQINEVESVSKPFQPAVAERRLAILNKHYAQLDEWQIESNKIGLLIGHYFGPQVFQRWRQSQTSIDGLLECSASVYRNYMEDPRKRTAPETSPCSNQLNEVKDKLQTLATAFPATPSK